MEPTLLNYQTVNLSHINERGVFDSADVKKIAEDILQNIESDAVELFGESSIRLALSLFDELAKSASEITYRKEKEVSATVIYTTVDEDAVLRPSDVTDVTKWTDEELDELEAKQQADQEQSIEIDLTELWDKLEPDNKEAQIKAFLETIYQYNPVKEKVVFIGEAPLDACLMAFNWFRTQTKEIYYEDTKIK